MASSFAGEDLFGSGPHRFVLPSAGHVTASADSKGPPATTGSVVLGAQELIVEVRGRLVASDDGALDSQRGAIAGALASFAAGTLVDLHGRSWTGMYFVRFEPGEMVDRGRSVSLAYVAKFHRFGS